MLAEAFSLTSWVFGIVPESTLSHKPQVQSGFVPKHSQQGDKNHRLFKPKNMISLQAGNQGILYSRGRTYLVFEPEGRWFLPLMMFSVAKRTGDDGGACARVCSQAQRHDSSTKARRAKTSAEEF